MIIRCPVEIRCFLAYGFRKNRQGSFVMHPEKRGEEDRTPLHSSLDDGHGSLRPTNTKCMFRSNSFPHSI